VDHDLNVDTNARATGLLPLHQVAAVLLQEQDRHSPRP
jgi:hypothetical protein